MGAAVSDDFATRNACSWSGDHRNSFLVLSNGRSGPSRPASVSVLAANWLANPKKARRSVRLEGIGNLASALVMAESMLYPSWDRLNPSLVPRPLPAFQCCTLKNGKAWFAKSREMRHY